MPTPPTGQRGKTLENIRNTLSELEEQRTAALEALGAAQGQAKLRLRTHLTFLERRLRWYRGRAEPKVRPEQQGYAEKQRRYARNVEALTEVHEKAL